MKRLLLFLSIVFLGFASYGQIKIGATTYGKLNEALAAAVDDDVITISGAISESEVVALESIASGITVFIQGETGADTDIIEFTAGNRFTMNGGGSRKVHFLNVTIKGAGTEIGNGGLFDIVNNGSVYLDNVICENGAGTKGGVARVVAGTTVLEATNCIFRNNTAGNNRGGAFYVEGQTATLYIDGSTFTGNSANQGGVIANWNSSSVNIKNSSFTANNANDAGGIYWGLNPEATINITNSTVYANEANRGGAMMTFPGGGLIKLINVTMVDNIARSGGNFGGIQIDNGAVAPEIYNSILHGNTGAGDLRVDGSTKISNSIIGKINESLVIDGKSNLIGDAAISIGLAVSANSDGVYTIDDTSQAIDLGLSIVGGMTITTDQTGTARDGALGRVDAGAYERPAYTGPSSIKIGDTEYASLKLALEAAVEDDIIEISGTATLGQVINLNAIKDRTDPTPSVDEVTIKGVTNGATIDMDGHFFQSGGDNNNITFFSNLTITNGGGENGGTFDCVNGGVVDLTNVIVTNSEGGKGGVARIVAGGVSLIANNSKFINNTASKGPKRGGAFYVEGDGVLKVYNSEFRGNSANQGGVVANWNSTELLLQGSSFTENTATDAGGIYWGLNGTAELTVVNSTIYGNTAARGAAMMTFPGAGTITLINTTITDNVATGEGSFGGIQIDNGAAAPEIYNSILYGNVGGDLRVDGSTIINNSIIGITNETLVIDGSSNLIGDEVTSLGLSGEAGADGVYALDASSQAIDLGVSIVNGMTITVDQVGNTRDGAIGRVDAGAHERPAYSGPSSISIGDVTYATLKEAILAAVEKDIINISGTIQIQEVLNFDALKNRDGQDPAAIDTIYIQGATTGATIDMNKFFFQTGGDNNNKTFFSNLTITNGQGDNGGAFDCVNGGVIDLDNVVVSNSHGGKGGVARIVAGGVSFIARNSKFINNAADAGARRGGAFYVEGDGVLNLYNCELRGNSANQGGVIANWNTADGIYIENSLLTENSATDAGGVYWGLQAGATIKFVNSTIFANDAVRGGAMMTFPSNTSGGIELINVTLAYNTATGGFGGIQIDNDAIEPKISNSVLYGNTGGDLRVNGSAPVNNSIIGEVNAEFVADGISNIIGGSVVSIGMADKLNGQGVLTIDESSQAANLGSITFLENLEINTDQTGAERDFLGNRVDAGAYELQGFEGVIGVRHSLESSHPTFDGLAMAGYQGWYNTPTDGSGQTNWRHWGNGMADGSSAGIDFWPDMREIQTQYETGFKYDDGTAASVYSGYDPQTVDVHYQWMREYGIDGVFQQRFASDLKASSLSGANDKIVLNGIASAKVHGRAYAIMYDLSGTDASTPEKAAAELKVITDDWNKLVVDPSYSITSRGNDQAYLYQDGKPVVAIWGVGFNNRDYDADYIESILDFLVNDETVGECAIMLGVPTNWRTGGGDTWSGDDHTRLLTMIETYADIIMPWHTGRYRQTDFAGGATSIYGTVVAGDVEWAESKGVIYAPNVSPGFSWRNLKDLPEGDDHIRHRDGGNFFWDMGKAAVDAGATSLYYGMFDENDEGTQIYKVDNNPPSNANASFYSYDREGSLVYNNPEDHYLWLAGEIALGTQEGVTLGDDFPGRVTEGDLVGKIAVSTSLEVQGDFEINLSEGNEEALIYYADPYSVPDGAPTVGAMIDELLFDNQLVAQGTNTVSFSLANREQYIRFVETNDQGVVQAFYAMNVDDVAGKIAAYEDFSDQNTMLEIDQFDPGVSVLKINLPEGHIVYASENQDTGESMNYFVGAALTKEDSAFFSVDLPALTDGVASRVGEFVQVIELDANGLVVGFNVFEYTEDVVSRFLGKSEEPESDITVVLSGVEAIFTVNVVDGSSIYRADLSDDSPGEIIYSAFYTNYSDDYPNEGKSEVIKFSDGDLAVFIEVDAEGKIVGRKEILLTSIADLSVDEEILPDFEVAGNALIGLVAAPEGGNKIYSTSGPSLEIPRRGANYGEVAAGFSEDITSSAYSMTAEPGDVIGLVEVNAEGIVIAYRAVTLVEANFSVAANPVDDPTLSAISVSANTVTVGEVNIAVTVDAGTTLYRTNALSEFTTVPTVGSSVDLYSQEFTEITGDESIVAATDDQIAFIEFTNGKLTGIYIAVVNQESYGVYYVSEFGDDSNDGSFSRPWKTVETALDMVNSGPVAIDDAPIINLTGKIQMVDDNMKPGYADNDGYRISGQSFRMVGLEDAVLIPADSNRVMYMTGGAGASYHFENITFTGARGSYSAVDENAFGGVFLLQNVGEKVVFESCNFVDNNIPLPEKNFVGQIRGAVIFTRANTDFNNCNIERNLGAGRAGVIDLQNTGGQVVNFRNCFISSNEIVTGPNGQAAQGVIGVAQENKATEQTVTFINSVISGNTSPSIGAFFITGAAGDGLTVNYVNSIVTKNMADNAGNGDGVKIVFGTVNVLNSMIFGNGIPDAEGNIAAGGNAIVNVENSYLGGQASENFDPETTGTFTIDDETTYNNPEIQGELNINAAPVKTASGAKTLYLKSNSWAIGKGNISHLNAVNYTLDAAGVERDGNPVDLGPTQFDANIFDIAPEINRALEDQIVEKSAADVTISLATSFIDPDGDDLTFTVSGNTDDGSLFTTTIDGTNLLLSFVSEVEGDAVVEVTATANGKSVSDEFRVAVGLAPFVANPISDVSINNVDGGDFPVNLATAFEDPDDEDSNIVLSVFDNSNPDAITAASFDGKVLTASVAPNVQGKVTITVLATSGIRTALGTVTFLIGSGPTVKVPLDAVSVRPNSAPKVLDMTDLFTDADSDDTAIVKSIRSNSNEDLVATAVDGNNLTLTFDQTSMTGTAVVEIEGISDGLSGFFELVVNVTENDLVVQQVLGPIKLAESAPDSVINVSELYYDIEAASSSGITVSVVSSDNANVASAAITDNVLTISTGTELGAANIRLSGTNGTETLEYTFLVTVGDVTVISVVSAIADQEIDVDDITGESISLDGIFEVVGNPDATFQYSVSNDNPTLIISSYDIGTNSVIVSSRGLNTGTAVVTVTASFDGVSKSTTFEVELIEVVIDGIEDELSLTVYPVPFDGSHLNIQVGDVANQISYYVYDASGNMLRSRINENVIGGKVEINFNRQLPRGLYFISISAQDKLFKSKLIVD